MAVPLNAKHAFLGCHYHRPIQHGHFTEGPEPRNRNHGYVTDFHANTHSVFGMKHGNVTLAKKNCYLVGASQERSRCITAKYHPTRAADRNHGQTIPYLQAVAAKENRVGQKRLAAQRRIPAASHRSDNRRTRKRRYPQQPIQE